MLSGETEVFGTMEITASCTPSGSLSPISQNESNHCLQYSVSRVGHPYFKGACVKSPTERCSLFFYIVAWGGRRMHVRNVLFSDSTTALILSVFHVLQLLNCPLPASRLLSLYLIISSIFKAGLHCHMHHLHFLLFPLRKIVFIIFLFFKHNYQFWKIQALEDWLSLGRIQVPEKAFT